MCVSVPLQVKKIQGSSAQMEDGRVIRLGDLENVVAGDFIEVYADLAVGKLAASEAAEIRMAQKGGRQS